MNTPPKCWHWPDHVAGKRETRRLREEHNAAVNSHAELLGLAKMIDAWLVSPALDAETLRVIHKTTRDTIAKAGVNA
jgi:hypothetical protein